MRTHVQQPLMLWMLLLRMQLRRPRLQKKQRRQSCDGVFVLLCCPYLDSCLGFCLFCLGSFQGSGLGFDHGHGHGHG